MKWLRLSQDGNKLCALLNVVITLWFQEKYGKFLFRFVTSHKVLWCMELTGGKIYDDFARKRVPIKNGKKKKSLPRFPVMLYMKSGNCWNGFSNFSRVKFI